jgi:hypothetical protein
MLVETLEPLLSPLYRFIEEGAADANSFFHQRGEKPHDPWLYPHIVRWHTCNGLDDLKQTNATLDYEAADLPMAGIEIAYSGHTIKVFKATDGVLPAAGRSPNRQAFFNGNLFGEDEEVFERANLAVIWDVDAHGSLILMQLVCPKAGSPTWKPGEVHWAVDIPHPATIERTAAAAASPTGVSFDPDEETINLERTADERNPS